MIHILNRLFIIIDFKLTGRRCGFLGNSLLVDNFIILQIILKCKGYILPDEQELIYYSPVVLERFRPGLTLWNGTCLDPLK